MKFVETIDGALINVDHIVSIHISEDNAGFHSRISTTKGSFDFMEIPDSFQDEKGNSIEFEKDHLITLHRVAAFMIAKLEGSGVIDLEHLGAQAWKGFDSEWKRFQKECEKQEAKQDFDLTSSLNGLMDALKKLQDIAQKH